MAAIDVEAEVMKSVSRSSRVYLEGGEPGNYNGGEGLPAGGWEGENGPLTNLTQILRHLTWISYPLFSPVFINYFKPCG